ncbi:DUF3299 domain-containing protein [Lutimaribacter marinistellae]|uniref:DUF3299 domain-containing protein n=1 Tax=Lutimaribacter marinistellae TaxID=1820329 RepID=A0ABV7TNI6_9RHOB
MTDDSLPTRRTLLYAGVVTILVPRIARANVLDILWEDLIPAGVPYAQIIGKGDMDVVADTWAPIFDENATKLNLELDGALVRLPGYLLPLELTAAGVTSFVLVPYVGACIHVPPPPPNQLVFVEAQKPWPNGSLWEPILVTGRLTAQMQSTAVAEIGHSLSATDIERFRW